ncbi:MAG: hypothetical protein ACPGJV_03770 [Bacteriovoracaceae bacterium]
MKIAKAETKLNTIAKKMQHYVFDIRDLSLLDRFQLNMYSSFAVILTKCSGFIGTFRDDDNCLDNSLHFEDKKQKEEFISFYKAAFSEGAGAHRGEAVHKQLKRLHPDKDFDEAVKALHEEFHETNQELDQLFGKSGLPEDLNPNRTKTKHERAFFWIQ